MKVLFLDIDGVLNSARYEPHTDTNGVFYFIDESRMHLLKNIVGCTGAKIVLSSTWRDAWEKTDISDVAGKYMVSLFAKYGLSIYDKTPMTDNYYYRKDEILDWLRTEGKDVTDFAILDDDDFDWGEISEHVVRTDPRNGFGLEEAHMHKVISILNHSCLRSDITIVTYSDKYAEQFKDLMVELQSYIASIDKWGIISLDASYRERYFNFIMNDISANDGIVYLAVNGDKAIGALVGKIIYSGEATVVENRQKIGFITDLVVKKDFRGKGIGTLLMNEAELYFKKKQCKFMQIEVFEPNFGASRMYEKYGFTNISRYLSKNLEDGTK